MINFEAFYKISYGLFLISSGNKQTGNGYISNTFFQVTAEPPKFATCCNKDNFTASLIQQAGSFAVTALQEDTPKDLFTKFGYKSGKDIDKLEGMYIQYGETGVPIIMNNAVAYFECKVEETIDLGTHLMFIGSLIQADIIDDTKNPITYKYYREVKKALAPKNAPTYIDQSKLNKTRQKKKADQYKCAVCGHVYDEAIEETPFNELPDSWKCPVCGADKEDFYKL